MITTEQKTIPCQEPGCGKTVDLETGEILSLRTGCRSSSFAHACPGCGRLYWGGSSNSRGIPVTNRQYEGAYYIQEELVHKPLLASEKSRIVSELIEAGKNPDQHYIVSFCLVTIAAQEHAPDCANEIDKSAACTCGLDLAKDFVAQNSAEQPDRQ